MSKKLITTINNEELPISKCKKFVTGYYKIGDITIKNSGDCYKINNKFYRFETGQIIYNESTNEYQLIDNSVILGLINNNEMGYFSKSEHDKIPIVTESQNHTFAINERVLLNNLNYREELSTGNFVHISLIRALDFNKIKQPKSEYKNSLPYDSKGITDNYSNIYNQLYDSQININSKTLGNFLGNLTFGLEFETIAGFVPKRITNKLGIIPLRDGSISGIEYVTVPLTGSKGVQTVVDICEELNKRTIFDNTCALHLHLGGIPRTKEFILAFFKLTCNLQDDIFSMFPLYKKYNLGIKNKNYSKPYDVYNLISQMDPVINENNINKNFNVLFSFLTSYKQKFINYNNDIDEVHNHPCDPDGNQKWNIKNRYFLNNFIPIIFGNKQTIEFRIHTPTFDEYKVLMFLLLNSLLIKFTLKFQDEILKDSSFFNKIVSDNNSLFNVINYFNAYSSKEEQELISYLKSYLSTRKSNTEYLTRHGNIQYEEKEIVIEDYNKINFKNSLYNNIKFNKKSKDIIIDSLPGFLTSDDNSTSGLGLFKSFSQRYNLGNKDKDVSDLNITNSDTLSKLREIMSENQSSLESTGYYTSQGYKSINPFYDQEKKVISKKVLKPITVPPKIKQLPLDFNQVTNSVYDVTSSFATLDSKSWLEDNLPKLNNPLEFKFNE